MLLVANNQPSFDAHAASHRFIAMCRARASIGKLTKSAAELLAAMISVVAVVVVLVVLVLPWRRDHYR